MSRPQDPQKPFLSFGNPFRVIFPRGSYLSPKLLDLLNSFEDSLTRRLLKLKPTGKEDVLCLSWMRCAMESLCGIHADIELLITALELPVCDWDDKRIDVYLDNSVKLLDICIAFSSEISRLKQSHLFLLCALHNLGGASSNQIVRAHSSMNEWSQHICSKNPRLDNCFIVMDTLDKMLDLPKIKNSSKGKVLMQAMYGVKVVTLYICSAFAAGFSGSPEKLMDLPVPETCLWAEAFTDLQTFVNTEIRNSYSSISATVLKELEAVDAGVKRLYSVVQKRLVEPVEAESLQNLKSDLGKSAEKLSQGLDLLGKEVDSFFQIVLNGRDALLCNLRLDVNAFDQVLTNRNVEGQAVR